MALDNARGITVLSTLINHSLNGAREQGYDISEMLRRSGVQPEILENPDARLPVEQVVTLLNHCIGTLRDESNGLLERPIKLGHFRILALSVLQTRTLGRAMQRMTEINNLFDNSLRQSLEITPTHAEFSLHRIPGELDFEHKLD